MTFKSSSSCHFAFSDAKGPPRTPCQRFNFQPSQEISMHPNNGQVYQRHIPSFSAQPPVLPGQSSPLEAGVINFAWCQLLSHFYPTSQA